MKEHLLAARDALFKQPLNEVDLTKVHQTEIMAGHDAHGDHSHDFFHQVDHFSHVACKLVTLAGTVILVAGVVLSLVNILQALMNLSLDRKLPMLFSVSYGEKNKATAATFGRVRQQLGEITALGLEVLVAADILETLTQAADQYSWHTLGKMVVIALLRTFLAVMLGHEIKEIEEKIHHEAGHDDGHGHHDDKKAIEDSHVEKPKHE